MGISGLLPFLEKSSKPINIKEYSGCTVAVDTYCWLHKGAFSCAEKLARGEQTDQYVVYCMKFINMLLSHNIKPILVFDGRHLPAKAETEKIRRERREMNRKKAAEMLRADRVEEARSLIRRCVDVTHEMASALMDRCRSTLGVDCIVAPYEADAQLAFFSIANIAHLVITEDSDLLLFGCNKVLFKMDLYGNGLLVDQSLIPLAMKQSADNFSLDKFRYMCILSGCDYLPSLPGIGLAKACKFIKMTVDDDICRALSRLGAYLNMKNLIVSQEYKNKFMVAVSMFKYQPIYDPFQRRLSTLTPLPEGEPLPIDERLPAVTCLQLALGNLNPFTLVKTNNWDPDDPKNFKTAGWNAGTIKNSIWSKSYCPPKQVVPKKSGAQFDKFVTRIEKSQCYSERKNLIEDIPSQKKNTVEEELNHLRNLYSIKSPPSKKKSCLEVVAGIDAGNLDTSVIYEDDIDVDDLFGEDNDVKKPTSGHKNPFSKAKTSQLTPLCGALSRMSKLSTPINGTNGEVSRYFSSSYTEKEVTPAKEPVSEQPANRSSAVVENILKDIINTPTKSPEVISKHVETPSRTRRNIFSTSPNKKTNPVDTSSCKMSSSRPSFLGMLDTMVSPTSHNEQQRKSKELIKTPSQKKQAKLIFPEAESSPTSAISDAKDNANMENTEPMKVTAIVKTLPTSVSSLHKVEKLPTTLLTTQKKSISHKLGPAKTIGLKRKKSLNNDNSKTAQPSIFEMFTFQPKTKLKIQ